jgi:hypothetical protein
MLRERVLKDGKATEHACTPAGCHSRAPGTGAHAVGRHGSIRSAGFGSVAKPITHAPNAVAQET